MFTLGEPIVEPEVDLSSFLERQRLSDAPPVAVPPPENEDEIDHSLAHLISGMKHTESTKKGKLQQISWDDSLEELSQEKAAAEATRGNYRFYVTQCLLDVPPHVHIDLKARFKAKAEKERFSGGSRVIPRSTKGNVDAEA